MQLALSPVSTTRAFQQASAHRGQYLSMNSQGALQVQDKRPGKLSKEMIATRALFLAGKASENHYTLQQLVDIKESLKILDRSSRSLLRRICSVLRRFLFGDPTAKRMQEAVQALDSAMSRLAQSLDLELKQQAAKITEQRVEIERLQGRGGVDSSILTAAGCTVLQDEQAFEDFLKQHPPTTGIVVAAYYTGFLYQCQLRMDGEEPLNVNVSLSNESWDAAITFLGLDPNTTPTSQQIEEACRKKAEDESLNFQVEVAKKALMELSPTPETVSFKTFIRYLKLAGNSVQRFSYV